MESQSLTVNGQEYGIKFGMGALKILGRKWKMDNPVDVLKKVGGAFQFKEGSAPSWKQWDSISEVVLAGVQNVDPTAKIDLDDLSTVLIYDMELLSDIVELFMTQQPRRAEPAPAKKTRGKK